MSDRKREIWKFKLATKDGRPPIGMPKGAMVIHVGAQGGEICLWAEVTPSNPRELRMFRVHETGHSIGAGEYVGTAFIGGLVWHVYEVPAVGDTP